MFEPGLYRYILHTYNIQDTRYTHSRRHTRTHILSPVFVVVCLAYSVGLYLDVRYKDGRSIAHTMSCITTSINGFQAASMRTICSSCAQTWIDRSHIAPVSIDRHGSTL